MARYWIFSLLFVALLEPAEVAAYVKGPPASSRTHSEEVSDITVPAQPAAQSWLERLVARKAKKKLSKMAREEPQMEGFSVAGAVAAVVGILLLFTETAGIGAVLILLGGLLALIGLFRYFNNPGRFRKGSISLAVLGLLLGGLLLGLILSFGSQS